MNEPRGRSAMCMNLVLPPCDPRADAGFLIMESDEYPPMSGGNTLSTATVLLDTGTVKITEPVTKLNPNTPAGLVSVMADCDDGKCKAVAFDNVPAFVYKLDLPVDVPGLGVISVDIAWGVMYYAIIDARSVGLEIKNANGPKLIDVGKKIKQAVRNTYTPVHPDNDKIREVTIVESTEPIQHASDGSKSARAPSIEFISIKLMPVPTRRYFTIQDALLLPVSSSLTNLPLSEFSIIQC